MEDGHLYVSGMGALTPLGSDVHDLVRGLKAGRCALGATRLPAGCRRREAVLGCLGDFRELLACYVPSHQRRKMSRLSAMAVVASGEALRSAGLSMADGEAAGVVLATAFGSTGRSEEFFEDLLAEGPRRVNPGLFPETVPNAPAGQISLVFGLTGPNATVCRQVLSPELAVLTAAQMLEAGMAERMLVCAVEEMSPALLKGLDAMGLLKRPEEQTHRGIRFSPRTAAGEAAVALLLETGESLKGRGGRPLARLVDLEAGGAAVSPARYHAVEASLEGVLGRLLARCGEARAEVVVAGGSFVGKADSGQLHALRRVLDSPAALLSVPEYTSGNLMGAGLLRVLVGVLLLEGGEIPCTPLSSGLPAEVLPEAMFRVIPSRPSNVVTAAVSPGGGAGAVLLARCEQ
jgi:3-oxoacyl-[acyl-carrier-protein] synthase II